MNRHKNLPRRVQVQNTSHIQTWGVHTRRTDATGVRLALAMQLSIGFSILGAAFHGPFMMLIAAKLLIDACSRVWPTLAWPDAWLLVGAWAAAVLVNNIGARRAGLQMRLVDGLAAPLYWPLQSLAFLFAIGQLIRRPYHWDKTDHVPHRPDQMHHGLDGPARAGVSRAA